MPRRLFPFLPGEQYHVYNRGVNRGRIFFDNRNYMFFLFNLERYLTPWADLAAYCLMPTHFHLLFSVRENQRFAQDPGVITSIDISKAMMKVSVSYTKTVNSLYDRVGPLFQGAFQSKHIGTVEYYWQLINYIHENPVEAKLVEKPEDWLFSSVHDYAGRSNYSFLELDLGGTGDLGGQNPRL